VRSSDRIRRARLRGGGWRPAIALLVLLLVTVAGEGRAEVRYEGEPVFSSSRLDDLLGVVRGRTVEPDVLAARLPALLQTYVEEGYLDAVLRLRADGEDLVVEVAPGERVLVVERDLSGGPRDLGAALAEAIPPRTGHVARGEEIEVELRDAVTVLTEGGHPFAEARATDFRRDGAKLGYTLELDAGRRMRVDSLRVRGLEVTRPGTARRIACFEPGERFRESTRHLIGTRLARSGLFASVGEVGVVRLEDGRGVYDVEVTEAPATILHGVVGVGGRDQELTGLLDVTLSNLFGTARDFRARWEGRGQGRASYELAYHEPWIWTLPLAVDLGFEQDQEDTLYTRTAWRADLALAVHENLTLRAGWQVEETSSPVDVLVHSERDGSRLGLRWDGRETLGLGGGGLLDLTATTGTQEERYFDDTIEKRDVTTLEAIASAERFLGRWTSLHLGSEGFLREARGEEPRPENLFPMGGAQSIRGYEERRFRTGLGAVLRIELRRYTGPDRGRVLVFVDGAYLDPSRTLGAGGDAWKLGAGIGLRAATRLGLLGVDLAASEEIASYEDLRIHMSVEARY